ncbi:hypothetical protein [Streptomyces sp. NPDC097610]
MAATIAVPNAVARTSVDSWPMGMGTKDENSSWAPTRENNSFGT